MTADVRWQQRFSNYCSALEQLETFFEPPLLNEREQEGLEQAWLFGSRAMGRHRPGSDLDLCLMGDAITHQDRLRLMHAIDELLLPWSVDLALWHELPEDLRGHLQRAGRCLWHQQRSASA